jgi:hypothetical protein
MKRKCLLFILLLPLAVVSQISQTVIDFSESIDYKGKYVLIDSWPLSMDLGSVNPDLEIVREDFQDNRFMIVSITTPSSRIHQNVLLDPEGKVLAQNLRGANLYRKLFFLPIGAGRKF